MKKFTSILMFTFIITSSAHADQIRFFGHPIGGGGGAKGHSWKTHGVGANVEAMLGCNPYWDKKTDCVLDKRFYMDIVGLYEGSDTQLKDRLKEIESSSMAYRSKLKVYRKFKSEHPEFFEKHAPQHYVDVLKEEETGETKLVIRNIEINNHDRKQPELALEDGFTANIGIDTSEKADHR